jgi:multidrug efflux system outer membrane protein
MKRLFLIGLAATGVGCMVGPDYQPPVMQTSAQFAATTQPVATQPATSQPATTQPVADIDLRLWWYSFNDEKLNGLIDRAMKNNLDVALAEARVREARATYEFNRGALLPTVDGSGTYSRSRTSKNILGASSTGSTGSTTGGTTGTGTGTGTGSAANPLAFSVGTTNFYQVGFDAGWEIDVFGGTRRAIESAQYTLESQVEARRAAMVTLLAEVARNYVTLRGLQHELAIVQDNIGTQQDTESLTRAKFQAGIATDLEVAQSEALLATTESEVPTLQTQIQQSIHRLSVLINQSPDALEADLSVAGVLPPAPVAVPAGLPSDLIRRRPDVRQSERLLAASTANIGVAVADLFPKFNLTGSLGLESLSLKTLANSSSEFWSFGPSVTWKIFSAGQVQANIRVQTARQEEAFIQYRQSVLNSLADVEDALVAYNQEQARQKSLQRAVSANQRAFDLAKQLNTAGVVDFLNVLTAQQSLFQSEDQLAQSDQTVSTNLIALYKALGGGWELTDQQVQDRDDKLKK